jgi:spore cortex biosynthesis protein YabQ
MQDIPVNTQFTYFLTTVILGIAVGLLFDFYRTCRYYWRPRRHLAFVMDLLFCLVSTAVVYAGLLLANWGEVRFYVFVGMGLGLALYYVTVSRFFLLLMRRLLAMGLAVTGTLSRGVSWGVVWLVRLISIPLRPFIYLGRLLKVCFAKSRGTIGEIGGKVSRKAKKYVNFFPKRKS